MSSQTRDGRLADLALQRAVALQMQDLDQLLGDRAAALDDLAGRDVARECPHDPAKIEPPMAVEAPVLDADHRIDERIRKFREAHIGRLERALAGERLAVGRFENHRRLRAPGERGAGRQIVQRPDERSGEAADEEQKHCRDTADPDGPARQLPMPSGNASSASAESARPRSAEIGLAEPRSGGIASQADLALPNARRASADPSAARARANSALAAAVRERSGRRRSGSEAGCLPRIR